MLKSGRKSSQGRAHPLVIQYQMVSSENIHVNNIIQTEQVVFMNLGAHTHNAKEVMNLKKSKVCYVRGFGGRTRKGK